MFNLEPNPTFTAKVRIHVPGQGMGEFEVEFRHLKHEERKRYVEALADKSNLDALMEIVKGWGDIDAAFSREALEALLNEYQGAAKAFFSAFWNELSGAAAKN